MSAMFHDEQFDVKSLIDEEHERHLAGLLRKGGALSPRKFRKKVPRTSLIADAAKLKIASRTRP